MKNTSFLLAGAMASMLVMPSATALAHDANDFSHAPILKYPIAGVKNSYWYDYLSDIREAEHELRKDLARATDEEDRIDAREEYRNEIADAHKDYAKEMRERGYRVGRVTVGQ